MRRLSAALAAALLVAACSGGESTDEAVIESLQASLLLDETFAEYELTEPEALCVASRAVEALGAERMIEIGATDESDETVESDADELDFADLSDDEIITLGDAMEECVSNIDALLTDAIVEGILEDPDPDFPVEEPEARCVAEEMADQFSLSRMILLGVRGDEAGDPFADLNEDEIEIFADAMVGCIDVRQILLEGIAASGASDEAIACLDEQITDDDIKALFTSAFSGDDSDAAAAEILGPAVDACS